MSYGHGWRIREGDFPALRDALPWIAKDLKALIPHLPPLARPDGSGAPLLFQTIVAFNGVAPLGNYEAFSLTASSEGHERTADGSLFGWCKTGPHLAQARPYDLAVQVALTLARWHVGEAFEVNTDGNLLLWERATQLVTQHLGYPVDPFYVLDKEVWEVVDRRGKVFYVEAKRDRDILRFTDWWLKEMERMSWIPFQSPFRYRGPVKRFSGEPMAEGVGIQAQG